MHSCLYLQGEHHILMSHFTSIVENESQVTYASNIMQHDPLHFKPHLTTKSSFGGGGGTFPPKNSQPYYER